MDPFEIDRRLPSHQQRLAKEKQVNCYFIPGKDSTGGMRYAYVVCSATLHEDFVSSIRLGAIPDFAVVVAAGAGEPDAKTKERMLLYYGYDETEASA